MDHKVGSVDQGLQAAANQFMARAARQKALGQDVLRIMDRLYPSALLPQDTDLLIFHPPKTLE